jgi:sulfite dehydrogenase
MASMFDHDHSSTRDVASPSSQFKPSFEPVAGRGTDHKTATLVPPLPDDRRGPAILDALPGKQPLIRLSQWPPNYETPIQYLDAAITPNDAFFVRCNLPELPRVDLRAWRLCVGGDGANGQAELTLDQLRRLPAAEVVAVCQCSGNRRSLFEPRVEGVQWGHGAMGCARFKGARLKDVLATVGLKTDALEILLHGGDKCPAGQAADFVKSLPVWKAVEDATLIAYEMNGEPLPLLHGFPARVIVPGWTATYWVKHVTGIVAATRPCDGYWMTSTYRVPRGRFPAAGFPSQERAADAPVTDVLVNSLITRPLQGSSVRIGAAVSVTGIAWDGGCGIRRVEVSTDGGESWQEAELGEDHGRFAARRWSCAFVPRRRGHHVVMARATNFAGQRQTAELIFNPAGYLHNAIATVTLVVA